MNISTLYSENAREIVVTTFRNRKPVTKVITDKTSGLTTIEIYKEDVRFPIEKYVYNRVV
jgi:hypothetical protein